MSMTPDEIRRDEENIKRTLDDPMPQELKDHIADVIEPSTMSMIIDHGDVMTCIEIAYLEIRDYLASLS